MPHRYQDIASDLRERIESGEFPAGSRLPGVHGLARHYGTGTIMIREAIGVLELHGVLAVRTGVGRGTFVVDQTGPRHLVDIGRSVRRNEYGYVFTRAAGHWAPVTAPTREWVPCPPQIAPVLDVPAGSEVLVRSRAVGVDGKAAQITRTYIPADIARGTVLAEADTGPGGILDRLEADMGYGPLKWAAEVSARLPSDDEAATLLMSGRLPVLITTRTHTAPTGRVVAVDEVVIDAQRGAVRVPITRGTTARWPVTPATARNGLQNTPGGDTPQEVNDQPPGRREAP